MFATQKVAESKLARIAELKIGNEHIFIGNAELKDVK